MRVLVKHPDLRYDNVKFNLGECDMPDVAAKCFADRGLVEILPELTLEVSTPKPKKKSKVNTSKTES